MNTILAITWSPKPTVYSGLYKPCLQVAECNKYLKPALKHFKEYNLFPELNAQGNIHFHMQITLTSKHEEVSYFKSFLPTLKRNGFVFIKNKNINDKWLEYIRKDKDLMVALLPDYGMVDEKGTYIGIRYQYTKRCANNIRVAL